MGKKQPIDEESAADIVKMPLPELKKRVDQAVALFEQLDELLPGLLELTDEARRHTSGNYRNGEAEALEGLLVLSEKKPALFESLADHDKGDDPTRFESGLIRDRLERAILLGPLVTASAEFTSAASDTRLHLSNLTRPVLLAMYEIVKPHAKKDSAIASMCKAALDFYSAMGRAAAATRRKKKGGGD